MNKRNKYKGILSNIYNNGFDKIKDYLINNSNLPGPAVNLSLSYAFADLIKDIEYSQGMYNIITDWLVNYDEVDVNEPKIIIPVSVIQALGEIFNKISINQIKNEIIDRFKYYSNDKRWRIREAVCFALQRIGENDFNAINKIFLRWINNASLLEQRAIIVSLAHYPILNKKDNILFSLEISEVILNNILKYEDKKNEDFRIIKKALSFTLSVYVSKLPDDGFKLLEKWAKVDDKDIKDIIKSNLKKSRLSKNYKENVDIINRHFL